MQAIARGMQSIPDVLKNASHEKVEEQIGKRISLFGATVNSRRIRVVINEEPVVLKDVHSNVVQMIRHFGLFQD